MRKRTIKGERVSWAWRYLSFEGRLGLFLLHRMPRYDPARTEAAHGLRQLLRNRSNQCPATAN
jgi:hypothetical protein